MTITPLPEVEDMAQPGSQRSQGGPVGGYRGESLGDQWDHVAHRPSGSPYMDFRGGEDEPLKLHIRCFVYVLGCVLPGGWMGS